MEKKFWNLIWTSFLKIQGFLIGAIGILLTILLWLFPPDINIQLRLILPIGLVFVLLIMTFAVVGITEKDIQQLAFESIGRKLNQKEKNKVRNTILLNFTEWDNWIREIISAEVN